MTVLVPTSADLMLVESATIREGAVQPDGSVLLDLIRPCVGRGRGKHLYTAAMLEANADKFSGWKMYLNHLSEAARRALGGLPRDVREVGGIVDEAWWDPSVPASGRFGQGSVVGRVKPINLVKDLIALDPRLVECSINASATGVKPGKVGNDQVWVVEGISNDPPGSVDWVTEAGAGGQVRALMESVYEADDPVGTFLDSLSYEEIVAHVMESHDLAEAAAKRKPVAAAQPADGDDGPDDDDDDDETDDGDGDAAAMAAMVKKFTDKGMPEAAAKKAAAKAMSAQEAREGVTMPLTPEELREALQSEDGQGAIALAVASEMKALDLGTKLGEMVEARLTEERTALREESDAREARRVELYGLAEYAQERVGGTKLTPKLAESIVRRFSLDGEGKPSAELNIVADLDENGSVTKSARAKLDEALDAAIKDAYEILAEANPTRVRGQGPLVLSEGAATDEKGEKREPTAAELVGPKTASLLAEAGITDPKAAFAITPESVRDMTAKIGG